MSRAKKHADKLVADRKSAAVRRFQQLNKLALEGTAGLKPADELLIAFDIRLKKLESDADRLHTHIKQTTLLIQVLLKDVQSAAAIRAGATLVISSRDPTVIRPEE